MRDNVSEDYSNEFRRGTFDKCNGRPFMPPSQDEPDKLSGYFDAYSANEVRIEGDDYQRGVNLTAQLAFMVVMPYLSIHMPKKVSVEFRRGMLESWEKFLKGVAEDA